MILTLTTDFGLSDTYVGQMKGVALGIAPGLRLVDLTHRIPPQNIRHGAAALEAAVNAFPCDTIHVAVVDPGVGSSRAPVAIASNAGPIFVGPDNGVFELALAQTSGPRQIVRLENRAYHQTPVSPTFHGRDIFAPVAAHVADGTPLEHLGPAQDALVSLGVARPLYHEPSPALPHPSITAEVLYCDHFGNAITTIRRSDFPDLQYHQPERFTVALPEANAAAQRLAQTFADVEAGEVVAYFGSSQRLELAIRDGNLANTFKVRAGMPVRVAVGPSQR